MYSCLFNVLIALAFVTCREISAAERSAVRRDAVRTQKAARRADRATTMK